MNSVIPIPAVFEDPANLGVGENCPYCLPLLAALLNNALKDN